MIREKQWAFFTLLLQTRYHPWYGKCRNKKSPGDHTLVWGIKTLPAEELWSVPKSLLPLLCSSALFLTSHGYTLTAKEEGHNRKCRLCDSTTTTMSVPEAYSPHIYHWYGTWLLALFPAFGRRTRNSELKTETHITFYLSICDRTFSTYFYSAVLLFWLNMLPIRPEILV